MTEFLPLIGAIVAWVGIITMMLIGNYLERDRDRWERRAKYWEAIAHGRLPQPTQEGKV